MCGLDANKAAKGCIAQRYEEALALVLYLHLSHILYVLFYMYHSYNVYTYVL